MKRFSVTVNGVAYDVTVEEIGGAAAPVAPVAPVAAYIDSDPALSSQFAGGFRVVSFKKKNGKTSWNH